MTRTIILRPPSAYLHSLCAFLLGTTLALLFGLSLVIPASAQSTSTPLKSGSYESADKSVRIDVELDTEKGTVTLKFSGAFKGTYSGNYTQCRSAITCEEREPKPNVLRGYSVQNRLFILDGGCCGSDKPPTITFGKRKPIKLKSI